MTSPATYLFALSRTRRRRGDDRRGHFSEEIEFIDPERTVRRHPLAADRRLFAADSLSLRLASPRDRSSTIDRSIDHP